MIAGFKKFILGGNIVDLAVGVTVGAAFATLVGAFTSSFITPLIGVVTGGGTGGGSFEVSGQTFTYGAFIGAVVTFLVTMAALYLVLVVPLTKIKERKAATGEDPTNEEKMVALLEQIAKK